MNSKERMRCAMTGNTPDRVPVMCQLSLGHLLMNFSQDPLRFWYTSEGLAEAFIAAADRYHFDGILINTWGRNPEILNHVVSMSPYLYGHKVVWDNGDETYLPPNDDPLPNKRKTIDHRPTAIEDIDEDAIRVFKSVADVPSYSMGILDAVLKARSKDLSIHGEIGTVFERFLVLFRSYGDGLVALLDDPAKSKRIMDKMNRSCIVDARIQCEKGIDALKLSSPFAGAGFISRQMYREFVLPYEKAVIDSVREYNIPTYIHTCGAIGDRLDLLADTGTTGIECLDPFPLGNVDLATAVRQVGDRVFFKGNLDSVNELLRQSPQEVLAIAKDRIQTGMQNKRGFILSTACSVAPPVPPENIDVLYEAVEAFGRY